MQRRLPRPVLAIACLALAGYTTPLLAQERTEREGAEGQDVELEPEAPLADLKVGPFYVKPRFSFRDLGWDSNVNVAAETEARLSDVRGTFGAGTELLLPIGERHRFTADGHLEYLWFRENSEFRTFNTLAAGTLELNGDTIRARISNRFVDLDRSLFELTSGEVASGDASVEIADRIGERINTTDATVTVDVTRRVFLRAEGRRRAVKIDQEAVAEGFDLSDRLDRSERSLAGLIGFNILRRTQVAFLYEIGRLDYDSPDNFREADSSRAGVRFSLREEGPYGVSWTLFLGFRELQPKAAGLVGFDGLVADGQVAITGDRVRVLLSGAKDVWASFWFDNLFFEREGGGLELIYKLSREVSVSVGPSFYYHRYPVPSPFVQEDGTIVAIRRTDETYRLGGGLRMDIGEDDFFRVDVNYFERRSNDPRGETEGLVVGSGYTIIF